ncbi:MAG: hypothetical protein ACI8U3_000780 [Brevundimonas sp.]|jgi:hypothetical protein
MAGFGARVGARASATQRRLQAGALALGLVMIAGPALAQSASERAGLRTLTWPGKAEAPAAREQSRPQAVSATTPAAPQAETPAVQPSRLPDYTAAAASFPQSLTPATAFGVPPVAGGGQAYGSSPVPYAAVAGQGGAAVRPTPVPQTPVRSTPVPQTPVSAPQDEPADPMAPRRDAAIWRLTDRQAEGQAQAEAAPQPTRPQSPTSGDRDGARYYSVHREAGRTPDPTSLPAPFFLDSAPVDLAEPPPPPTLMRNQGGLAPSVAGDAL